MLITNPIVAAAAVTRSVGSFPGAQMARLPTHLCPKPKPSFHEALTLDMEENLHDQARDLESFVLNPAIVHDAEIPSEETFPRQNQSSPKPPPLPDTNDSMVLLGLEPEASFDDIRRAYKEMAKRYHPDVVAGPDASSDEKKVASWDFARINTAFDILKRREEEEAYEYITYVDGERVTRSATVSEESLKRDPYRIDYGRIVELAEYRKLHSKKRMWYEGNCDCQPGCNGFDEPYSVGAHSKGKWRMMKDFDRCDRMNYCKSRYGGFGGPITSDQKRWEERQIVNQQGEARGRGSFGTNHNQYRLHSGGTTFEEPHNNCRHHSSRSSQRLHQPAIKQGHPYKNTVWNERIVSEEASQYQLAEMDGFDYDARDIFPLKEKWWKRDETTSGFFSP